MTWRWSQTARRLPAKQLQVGSTPTGASLEAMIRPGQRRTPPCPLNKAVGDVCSVNGFWPEHLKLWPESCQNTCPRAAYRFAVGGSLPSPVPGRSHGWGWGLAVGRSDGCGWPP